MLPAFEHTWRLSLQEARELQENLKARVKLCPLNKKVDLVAGVDISFEKGDEYLFASVVIYSLSSKAVVEKKSLVKTVSFPYVPGFLSFRELPALVPLLKKLRNTPDLILCDGQGIAHPRGFGLASHLGVLFEIPTVGCGKSRLVGEFREPGKERGASTWLLYEGMRVGRVVRTKENVKPVFVSPGHLIDIEGSVRIVLECAFNYRLPEPLRLAHLYANQRRLRFKKPQ